MIQVEVQLTPEQASALKPIYDQMMALADAMGEHVVTLGQLRTHPTEPCFDAAKFTVVGGSTADALVDTMRRYRKSQKKVQP